VEVIIDVVAVGKINKEHFLKNALFLCAVLRWVNEKSDSLIRD
tara:strand:+ start:81695 stop:81823 length:129 start_codon:yes stop_codon:yes gene_type:complete